MLTLIGQSGQFDLPVYRNKLVLHETLRYTDVKRAWVLARDRVSEDKLDSE